MSDSLITSTFALFLECKKIIFLQKKSGGEFPTRCHMCGMKIKMLDEPGAWGPANLQGHFPGEEPWMVDDPQAKDIRILCPKCGKYSLRSDVRALRN